VLARSSRLRRSAEFTLTVRRGRRVARRLLVLHLLRTEAAEPPRCGFVVSKAVGSAAARNLVKRRLRHLMREKMPLLPEGSMLVVRALPAASGADAAGLGGELDEALTAALARTARAAHRSGGR
jgi:ribonuclease P protein component